MKLKKYALCACMAASAIQFAGAQTATTPDSNPPTINFDKTKDLFLAQFDSKPDPDDIHSIAALGCMLAHPDLHNIDYYGVQGSVGKQNGKFIASPALMNLTFGPENTRWTQAGVGETNTSVGTANWNASVDRVRVKAKAALDRGGNVYVMDAGNENFTHDWVQELVAETSYTTTDTQSRVIVVQHSNWNEEQTTTAGVLNWVRDNTDYRRIQDGNGANNTPDYQLSSTSFVTSAESSNNQNSHARALWLGAESAITAVLPRTPTNEIPTYSSIRNRGVDFSDAVEAWYIFNIGANADTTQKFWDRYVTNTNSANGPVPREFGGGGNGTPFGGSAKAIPGTIQAEDFNDGAQGVAYNDNDTANSGGSTYRNSGVDIFDGNAEDSARAIGWIGNGEYLNYDVNVTTGSFDIVARVASASTNPGDLNVTIDGIDLGTFSIVNTGGWRSFQEVTIPNITLGVGGARDLRLTAVGGSFNVDLIRFDATGGGSGTGNFQEQNGFLVMEAESATLPTGWASRTQADIPSGDPAKLNGFTGDGFIVWTGAQVFGNTIEQNQAQGVITYTFDVTNPGVYNVRWRSKQQNSGQTFDAGNDNFIRWASGTTPSGSRDWSKFTKVYIQNKDTWDLNFRAEPEHAVFVTNDFKRQLSAGTHSIQIAARSPGHVIDRLIVHRSDVPFNATQFASAPESPRSGPPVVVEETISAGSLPSSVESAASYNVQVPYTANQDRDVIVALYNNTTNTWLGGGRTAVNAGSGTASVTVNMSNGTVHPAGSNYQWRIALPLPGGNWNPDANANKNVTLTSAVVEETISAGSLPSSIETAASFSVQVPYTANQDRDVIVALYDTGVTPNVWLGGGKTAVGPGSGTATVTVNLGGGAPAAGSNYQWRIALPLPGGNWNPDANANKNVTLTSTVPDNVGDLFTGASFSAQSNPTDANTVRVIGGVVGYIRPDSWIRYDGFNFGSAAASVTVNASTGGPTQGGNIEFRLGSPTGTLISTVNVTGTAGWNTYQPFNASVSGASGVHDLYLVFKGVSGSAFYLLNVQDFAFSGASLQPVTVNIAPAADVYFENSNKLTNNVLKVENSANRPRVSYLRFNVSGVSGSITDAKLRLELPAQANGGDNGSGTISVYKGSGNDAWTEASISSGNVPSQGVLLGSKSGAFGFSTTHEFSLTAGQIPASGNVTLILKLDNSQDIAFSSKEGTSAPQLIITSQ